LLVIAIAAVAVIALGGIAALRLRGRGYRGTIRAVLKSSSVTSSGDFTNVIFLHHSTGDYLINQGGVRKLLAESGYELWDHDYNGIGVMRPDGTPAGFHYRVPDDNTDPDGLARIFAQRAFKLPFNALSGLLQHDVIIFKSCFPTSNITSDRQLEQYKEYYLSIRDTMDQHPDKVFIAMTPPPLIPAATDPEAASRARAFSDWLESDEYLGGHPNVFVFDFFDLLAEDDPAAPDYSMLREAYRYGSNSYPNRKANETIGPLFADFIVDAASAYREMENGN
jgi:hypothetical protein